MHDYMLSEERVHFKWYHFQMPNRVLDFYVIGSIQA